MPNMWYGRTFTPAECKVLLQHVSQWDVLQPCAKSQETQLEVRCGAVRYTFVLQSLLLWREIMGRMLLPERAPAPRVSPGVLRRFELWQMTEEDLLDASST